ncbi:excisionase family protein [Yersinia enterocolitica]
MEGLEYKHVAPDGQPYDNSMCFYNRDEIDKWIERQPAAISRKKSA